jgi:aromatic ring-opening dioxygenase LigB subunit
VRNIRNRKENLIMGKIISTYILPHPPIIVPGIGRGRERQAENTVKAVKRAALEIGKDRPGTIILSSPHAPCFRDFIYIETLRHGG